MSPLRTWYKGPIKKMCLNISAHLVMSHQKGFQKVVPSNKSSVVLKVLLLPGKATTWNLKLAPKELVSSGFHGKERSYKCYPYSLPSTNKRTRKMAKDFSTRATNIQNLGGTHTYSSLKTTRGLKLVSKWYKQLV